MIEPAIEKWECIFLDTTIVISVLLAKSGNGGQQERFVFELIKFLSHTKTITNKDRRFLISAITISEIWDKSESDTATTRKVIRALDAKNTEFVSFDEEIAELFKSKYHNILNKKVLNDFAKKCSWPEHDLVNGREWVLKDAMILASSTNRCADIILTLDKATMYPMALKMDIPCALCYGDYFNHRSNVFYTYEETAVDL